jgi:RNA 2',3'-cyclic 3'-phosphodiesterase
MSVFIALDLDDAVRSQVTGLIALGQSTVSAKWLTLEKLHLTLVFLGNPTPAAVEGLKASLDPFAAAQAPFELALSGAGSFATPRAPAVLWLGVAGNVSALSALRLAALQHLGMTEERAYTPHVTLARARDVAAVERQVETLKTFGSSTFWVRHLSLYESTHEGYRALSRHAFS